jgi:glycosyl transferase family 9 (putative heptosyltransferase)
MGGCLYIDVEPYGYGDVLMLARWLPRVRQRVAKVVIYCPPKTAAITTFLQGQFEGVSLVTDPPRIGSSDAWTWFFHVPYLFGCRFPEGVRSAPYLRSTESFRSLAGAFRVGIVWSGHTCFSHDWSRSRALAAWTSVLEVPGVTFYSLQLGAPANQLTSRVTGFSTGFSRAKTRINDLAPELVDWSKTAAAMMELDLIISVDTAVAHLAGALGRPVWICLPTHPALIYPVKGHTTPYYDSARLYHQHDREWADMFSEVARDLRKCVASKGKQEEEHRGVHAATVRRWLGGLTA